MAQLRHVRIPTEKKGTTEVLRAPFLTPEQQRLLRRYKRYQIVQGLASTVKTEAAPEPVEEPAPIAEAAA